MNRLGLVCNSLLAGLFGNTLGPDDAYRRARGEMIISSCGAPFQLARPLDWMVVTDHSGMMGIATDIKAGAPNIVADKKGKEWHEGFKKGGRAAGEAELVGQERAYTSPIWYSPN